MCEERQRELGKVEGKGTGGQRETLTVKYQKAVDGFRFVMM